MTEPRDEPNDAGARACRSTTRDFLLLGLFACVFVVVRVPLMLRLPGSMDEDWFAVPGWTIVKEGIPRVPYAQERNRESYFYKADVMLYALPPAYFYWQAPVHWLFGPDYGSARLASGLAGLLAVFLVYRIACLLSSNTNLPVAAAGLYSLARVFFFPAGTARPDMLCTMFSLLAMLQVICWRDDLRWKRLVLSGAALGLAGLSHPFAIVPAVQVAAVAFLTRFHWKRNITAVLLLTIVSLATFSLWLPLILQHPDIFLEQFRDNADPSRTHISSHIFKPWQAFAFQSVLIWRHAGPIQTVLMAFGLIVGTRFQLREKSRNGILLASLTWSSVGMQMLLNGVHTTMGYYSYSGAFVWIGVAQGYYFLAESLIHRVGRPQLLRAACGSFALMLMLPGSGIRATLRHLQHWNDRDYQRPTFIAHLDQELPAQESYLVDPAFVFDWWLTGRPTTLGVDDPLYFHPQDQQWTLYLCGRYGIEHGLLQSLDLEPEPIRTFGNPDDELACFIQVYRRKTDHP